MLDKPRDEYYSNQSSRLNTIVGDEGELWIKIIAARDEYERENGRQQALEYFNLWLLDKWGIQLGFESGMVSLNATIVDEQKYTLFLLRY